MVIAPVVKVTVRVSVRVRVRVRVSVRVFARIRVTKSAESCRGRWVGERVGDDGSCMS